MDTIVVTPAKVNLRGNMSNDEIQYQRDVARRKSTWELKDSDRLKIAARLPMRWSEQLFLSDVYIDGQGVQHLTEETAEAITTAVSGISSSVNNVTKHKGHVNDATAQTLINKLVNLF
jgi:hypothetical protein